MASADDETRDKAMRRYAQLEAECTPAAATPRSPRPRRSPPASGCDERILGQPLGTLSGGQRRRVELSRILFSGAQTLLLDEPTNHLDADSIVWLRDYLRAYKGGLIIISHDVEMLDAVVNRVFHLDANRAEIDIYNIGWKPYLLQRETDERRRKRERLNAEKKAGTLLAQADKMRAKATKAVAAQNMAKRAERLLAGIEGERVSDKVAKLRSPTRTLRQDAADGQELSRSYGSLEIFTDVDLAIDRARGSWSSASTARARPRCCASCRGRRARHRRGACPGTGSRWATTPRSTRTSTSPGRSWRT